MIAVKNDIGLKRYEMHSDKGVIISVVQAVSWFVLSIKSANHAASPFLEKYANFSQLAGTLLNCSAALSASIASVMFSAPVRPSLRSSSDRFISPNRMFILSTSCRHTT